MTKPSIILIDDDDRDLQRLCSLFQEEFSCYVASDGESGLKVIEAHANDRPLVICDVNLPDITGFDVCRTVKSRYPDFCVILLTGFSDKSLRMEGLNAYADNYMDKAISDQEIQLTIRNIYNTFNPRQEIHAPDRYVTDTNRFMGFEVQVRNKILDYFSCPVRERVPDRVTVSGMADSFNTTTRTFQRNMERHTGSSYSKFFAETRLQKSKELLAAKFSVTEIAELLDYSSPSHFSREFKKSYGLTPNRYKREVSSLLP